jgi:hypothetical protein
MADIPYDEILSKFAGNQIDSKEFLNLLFSTDETGIDYLQSLKKEFKDKYVTPVFKKASSYYSKIGEQIDKGSKKENLDVLNDPLDIVKLNQEYKEKTKQLFEKKLKEIDVSVNIENPQQTRSVIEKIKDLTSVNVPETQPQNIQEQQTFGVKPTLITLSEKTIEDLTKILNLNFKGIKEGIGLKTETKEEEAGGGLLSTLAGLLAFGGVAALLVSAFWDKIKPWLEEKIGVKLGFLDKFEGLVEGIGKFFTLGGLKITAGPLFNLVGKAFTTFGDLLEGGLKAIFKLGFGDEIVEAGTKAAPAVWKTLLPKIAGGLFKGTGKVALRGIPIIGSLISFYFAYDRFQKGEVIQGLIEIAGGLAGLIPGVGIPLSIGIAALNAFIDYKVSDLPQDQQNAAAGGFVGNIGAKIYGMIKDIPFIGGLVKFGLGIYELVSGNFSKGLDYLVEQPYLGPFPALIKSLMNAKVEDADGSKTFSFDAFQKELKNNMFKWIISMIPNAWGMRGGIAKIMGLEYNDTTGDIKVSDDPADLASINKAEEERVARAKQKLEGLNPQEIVGNRDLEEELNRLSEISKTNVQKAEESAKTINLSLKTAIGRILTSGGVVGLMGNVADVFAQRQIKDDAIQEARQNLIEVNNLRSEVAKLKDYTNENGEIDGRKVSTSFKNKIQFSPQIKDDYEFNSNFSRGVLFDNKNNTANIMSPDDNILAYKTDGIFDKSLKQMTALIDSINKGIYKMSSVLETNESMKGPSINIAASQESGSNYKDLILSGSRDSIYELRNNWWRSTTSIRDFA